MVSLSIGGPDASQFTITPGTDTCSAVALPAWATCTVELTFSPTAAGDFAATLAASASPGGTANAALSGRGI
jgi:hypothetical protein